MAAKPKGHKQTSDRVEFCRIPDCEADEYRAVCPEPWKHEAHHILCVAQINKTIGKAKKELKQVIDESKWCINSKKNMIALPVWGTTVLFYTKDFSSIAAGSMRAKMKALMQGLQGDLLSSTTKEPAFKDLPQHNYGHSGASKKTSYNKEVESLLKEWISDVKDRMTKHKITGDDVHQELNDMADDMREALVETRGMRVGCDEGTPGTHAAWMNPNKTWYMPFSMADVPKKLPYPKMTDKVVKLAKAFWR